MSIEVFERKGPYDAPVIKPDTSQAMDTTNGVETTVSLGFHTVVGSRGGTSACFALYDPGFKFTSHMHTPP